MAWLGRFLYLDSAPAPVNAAALYHRVREKEGRIYTDALLARLPVLPAGHPFANEWRARAESCSRLLRHLDSLKRPLRILELGCGNGWLAHQLACLDGAQVWGLDRPGPELAQARQVFQQPNLHYLSADIFNAPFTIPAFDVIVLASVIQYFPDLPALLNTLLTLKKPGSQIHLLDSPLYSEQELIPARQRTLAYYTALGFPEMAAYYFHHPASALGAFEYRWLYQPDQWIVRLRRRIGQSVSPFPWVAIEGLS